MGIAIPLCVTCMAPGWFLLGITLNLGLLITAAQPRARKFMSSRLMAQVARFFRSSSSTSAMEVPASPAATLMQHADSSAGTDARYAQELRVAASAWLSVVR